MLTAIFRLCATYIPNSVVFFLVKDHISGKLCQNKKNHIFLFVKIFFCQHLLLSNTKVINYDHAKPLSFSILKKGQDYRVQRWKGSTNPRTANHELSKLGYTYLRNIYQPNISKQCTKLYSHFPSTIAEVWSF